MTQTPDQKCFICFGKTGSGKSTFIRALGGAVPDDDLVDVDGSSCTTEATFYPINEQYCLMDGPGFGDTRADGTHFSNVDHKNCILQKFHESSRTHFHGVIWFVTTGRAEQELYEEAQFIIGLGELLEKGSIWDHVVVMLRSGTRSTGVLQVVRNLQNVDLTVTDLSILKIGLRDDELEPGKNCDIVVSKIGNNFSMDSSMKARILDALSSQSPIKMIKRTVRCRKCHQEGDDRAFSNCHDGVKATHRFKPQHRGYLLRCHGERDNKDKHLNRLKWTGQAFGTTFAVAGAVTAAAATVLSAVATTAAPNPATAAFTAQCAVATVAFTKASTCAMPFTEGAKINKTAPPFRCAITKVELKKKDLKVPIIGKIARRGVCQGCGGDVATTKPCRLVWTCCDDRLDPNLTDLNYGLGSPCGSACEASCKLGSKGCIDECTKCQRTSNQEEAFKRSGCVSGPHDLSPC